MTTTRPFLLATLLLSAFAAPRAQGALLQPFGSTTEPTPAAPWQFAGLPRQKLPLTRFALVDLDGRRALRVEAEASYGNLVHPLRVEGQGATLAWQWRIDHFVAQSDLRSKAGDDTALKVCVFFELPLAQVPFVERQLLRMARARSGEALPSGTVCYVWDRLLPAGTVLPNAYTRRVRYLVLQGGASPLQRWAAERRDVGADFARLFGDESAQVPAIVGVAVGADADNTQGRSLAHVADLVLTP